MSSKRRQQATVRGARVKTQPGTRVNVQSDYKWNKSTNPESINFVARDISGSLTPRHRDPSPVIVIAKDKVAVDIEQRYHLPWDPKHGFQKTAPQNSTKTPIRPRIPRTDPMLHAKRPLLRNDSKPNFRFS